MPTQKKSQSASKVRLSKTKSKIVSAATKAAVDNYFVLPTEQLKGIFAVQEQMKKLIDSYRAPFIQIAEIQRQMIESHTNPMMKMAESMSKLGKLQQQIAESVLHTNLPQLINATQSIRIEAFTGLYIESGLSVAMKAAHNGITTQSTVTEAMIVAGGQVQVGVEKETTSSITVQAHYKKVDHIYTVVEMIDDKMSSTQESLNTFNKRLERSESVIAALLSNPFQFFQIKEARYVSGSSHFIINDSITVPIKSKSLMDYVCQVLFSGTKKELTNEWYWDDIREEISILAGPKEASKITWKKMQSYVTEINNKVAMETTKKDLILIPRQEIIKLNPEYFS